MDSPAKLTVIVPLFPRHPGLRQSLASLRAQTLRPDLVVLVDNGTSPDVKPLAREIPGTPVEIVQSETADVADGINRAVEYLQQSEFVAVLTAGGAYAPARLERCRAAMEHPDPARLRAPSLVVTGAELVDSQGKLLADNDPRRAQLARLWEPGRAGLAIPDWLGAGDFVLGASNLFARRVYLAANPLPPATPFFPYLGAIQAGLQGLLGVIDEPLLMLNWFGPESAPSSLGTAGLLRAQFAMLEALREKLATSPEIRRNISSFQRAAWKNLSGLREDLFTQAALQLASAAVPSEVTKALERITGASGFLDVPPYLRDLRASAAAADPAAYAAALAKTRAELAALREDHARLLRIANASQGSGWVRLGAWLGERSARRIMEMEEDESGSLQPPNGKVQGGGENNPDEVRNKHPRGKAADRTESSPGHNDGNAEKNDLEKCESGVAQTEEKRSP